MSDFYVYVHLKPDLTPFYVGKWTLNIVAAPSGFPAAVVLSS